MVDIYLASGKPKIQNEKKSLTLAAETIQGLEKKL